MPKVLGHQFFNRSALIVARELLGKRLVRRQRNQEICATITEVEAYVGPHDLACHSARGRTPRTKVMYGPPGHWYVYFVYGVHWMLNIVTGCEGYPAAVLIRGVENIAGPARVTKFYEIDKKFNGKPATRMSGLWIEDGESGTRKLRIKRSKRIGVEYAGPVWANKLYRFHV